MTEAGSKIRFAYALNPSSGSTTDDTTFGQLRAWRQILQSLGFLGQSPDRYHGASFGNLSARDPDRPEEFVITASQSSGEEPFTREHLVRIAGINLARFWVDGVGEVPPSSDTLTHGAIYGADPRIQWIIHCRQPAIWENTEGLALPVTGPDAEAGTPGMIQAVIDLLHAYQSRPLVFATAGLTDGLYACGPTARDTGGLLVSYLARALA